MTPVVSGGRPVLGRWQGVFLCESRRVAPEVLPS